jgi:hypothetical protein
VLHSGWLQPYLQNIRLAKKQIQQIEIQTNSICKENRLHKVSRSIINKIRVNKLPLAGVRWQHMSSICFITFILRKIQKIVNSSTTTKAGEK